MFKLSRIVFSLLVLLIGLIAFQFSSWGIQEPVYSIVTALTAVVLASLFFINFRKNIILKGASSTLLAHSVGAFCFFITTFLAYAFGYPINLWAAKDILLTFFILSISVNIILKEQEFINLINLYVVLITISALTIVFTFASGFVVHEQYLPVPKNQLAPAYGIALITSVYLGLKSKGKIRAINITCFILLFACILVLRGRTVLLAVILTLIIFFVFYLKGKKNLRGYILLGALLVSLVFKDFIYDSVFLNYDSTDLNSISTGRVDRNINALNFLNEHLLGGELEGTPFQGGIVHNYVLNIIVSFGLIMSLPLFIIYCKYILVSARGVLSNSYNTFQIGPLAFIILIVTSLFEYTFPFSPGSTVFFAFFLFGQFLRNQKASSKRLKVSNASSFIQRNEFSN